MKINKSIWIVLLSLFIISCGNDTNESEEQFLNTLNCSSIEIVGDYTKEVILNNTSVILDIDVNELGAYSISTDLVNGYSFSGSGIFTNLGINTITLVGEGTPTEFQTDIFNVSFEETSCQFSINVIDDDEGANKIIVAAGERFTVSGANPYYLYVVDSNGELLWSKNIDPNLVAIENNIVYVADSNAGYSTLYALNLDDGTEIWTKELGSGASGDTIFSSNTVYISTTKGTLIAFDPLTGEEKWTFEAGNSGFLSTPEVKNDRVYVGFYDSEDIRTYTGTVFSIDASSGELIWKYSNDIPTSSFASPVVNENNVFVTSKGILYALDVIDGSVEWELGTEDDSFLSKSATLNDDRLFIFSGDELFSINIDEGIVDWSIDTYGGYGAPTIYNGIVYIKVLQGIEAIDINTKDTFWKNLSVDPNNSPSVFDNTLYVSSNNGLWAVNVDNGEKDWNFAPLTASLSTLSVSFYESPVVAFKSRN